MSIDPSEESGGWNCEKDALAEIQAYPDAVQAFVSSVFDRLSQMTEELLTRELARQQARHQSERDTLQNQIDHLATVVAELAETISEEKQLAGQKKQTSEDKYTLTAV